MRFVCGWADFHMTHMLLSSDLYVFLLTCLTVTVNTPQANANVATLHDTQEQWNKMSLQQ